MSASAAPLAVPACGRVSGPAALLLPLPLLLSAGRRALAAAPLPDAVLGTRGPRAPRSSPSGRAPGSERLVRRAPHTRPTRPLSSPGRSASAGIRRRGPRGCLAAEVGRRG